MAEKSTETVKVAIRIRPLNQREVAAGATTAVSVSQQTLTVASTTTKTFTYDNIYTSEDPDDNSYADQETVVSVGGAHLVDGALNGFNGCVFAYGQTGSGKSYSIFGMRDCPGYIPWTVERIFSRKKEMQEDPMRELRVWVSYLEIYNEHLHDLLQTAGSKSGQQTSLEVHSHPKLGIYVPGLLEAACDTEQQVQKLLDYGAKKRAVAATQMNAHSSRSHAVFTMKVQLLQGPKPKAGEKDGRRELHAKINLIDLAGSERQSRTHSEGEQLREACAINKSLSALGLVIKELSEESIRVQEVERRETLRSEKGGLEEISFQIGRPRFATEPALNFGKTMSEPAPRQSMRRNPTSTKFTSTSTARVPFRASKLTFLLKDSLAGNSKTHMMANISPASDSVDETISTLRFASSVKEIKTVAVQNLHTRDALVESLRNELQLLKAQLSEANSHDRDQVVEHERLLTELLKGYEVQIAHSREMDKLRESALEDMALTQEEISSVFGVDKMIPYLLNMSDDATLAGCLIYYIAAGQTRTFGSAQDNAICLQGIGIPDRLCVIENTDNETLMITKCTAEGRIVVAGQPLEQGVERQLHHGQRIFLGRAFAMKVAIPWEAAFRDSEASSEGSPGPGSPSTPKPVVEEGGLLLEGLEDEWASIEHSRSWIGLSDYLRYVSQQMPPDQAAALWNEVKRAVTICDEANDITAECRPEEGIRFEVDLTSALRMSVVVRVLRDRGNGEDCQQLYIWSVGQIIERLDRMRDCYHSFIKNGSLEVDPLQDPWHETRPSTIWQHIAELEKDYYAMAEECQRLKTKTDKKSLRPRFFMLWQGSSGEGMMMRFAFNAWMNHTKASQAAPKPKPELAEPVEKRGRRKSAELLHSGSNLSMGSASTTPSSSRRTRGKREVPPESESGPVGSKYMPAGGPAAKTSNKDKAETQKAASSTRSGPYGDQLTPVGEKGQGESRAALPKKKSPASAEREEATRGRQATGDTPRELEEKPAGAAQAEQSSAPAGDEMRQAFEQLRGELFEQRQEATRVRSQRTQLNEALDRFEKMLVKLTPLAEPQKIAGWADTVWPATTIPPPLPVMSNAALVSDQPAGNNAVPVCFSTISSRSLLNSASRTVTPPARAVSPGRVATSNDVARAGAVARVVSPGRIAGADDNVAIVGGSLSRTLSASPPAAVAVSGVDTNGDGRANFFYVGKDMDRNGIPDALEQAAPALSVQRSMPALMTPRTLQGLQLATSPSVVQRASTPTVQRAASPPVQRAISPAMQQAAALPATPRLRQSASQPATDATPRTAAVVPFSAVARRTLTSGATVAPAITRSPSPPPTWRS